MKTASTARQFRSLHARSGQAMVEFAIISFVLTAMQILMCDGSARFLSENVAAEVYAALITRAKGEVLGEY